MVVRIRIRLGLAPRTGALLSRQAALLATLLTPVALMAWALAAWRLASDLKWTGDFAIRSGVFSHWQVWIALGILVQFAAFLLHRAGRGGHGSDGASLS